MSIYGIINEDYYGLSMSSEKALELHLVLMVGIVEVQKEHCKNHDHQKRQKYHDTPSLPP
jgi:hypothetical protein